MSSTDDRTVDPVKPHYAPNMGHEMSDFSWTTVLWILPISVVILVGFTLVCMFWFRGFKDSEMAAKAAEFPTTQLNELRAKENEALSQYKMLDPSKGRIQIPIDRAMELVVQEHQNTPGREWKPITDIYLEGAAFAAKGPAVAAQAPSSGISIESIPETPKAETKKTGTKKTKENHGANTKVPKPAESKEKK